MNIPVAKIMSKVILAEKTVNIKLLGDSITHGVGGTGWEQNGEHIMTSYYRSPDSYCWAKQFKDYMEENFNCTVTNNGCSGIRIQTIIENFDTLVDEKDDIIICTIGTNNRHQNFTEAPKLSRGELMQDVYENILKLYGMLKDTGKDIIMIANIPASAENEKDGETYWRILHMNDINDLYTKASIECGFPFISMYNLFMEYCDMKNITVDSLLTDGLHPNDAGYDVMYKLIMKELGIARSVIK
ncbi:MAG: SGNH/GDSL hydrolase family protein [Clostridia bacterium]|nr:SGNH/GDSL hydrolase family protein [Clostridia bacterium]